MDEMMNISKEMIEKCGGWEAVKKAVEDFDEGK